MFTEQLNDICGRVQGALALSLVAKDGITVESVSSEVELDLEVLAAELLSEVRSINGHHRELDVGKVELFAINTEHYSILVSAVAKDYYLLMVLGQEGLNGRARFELRRARLQLEPELS